MNFNSYGGVNENVKRDGFENIRKHCEKMWQEVKENIEGKAQKMKGEGRRRKEFKVGDKVMVKELGLKRKAFETRYDGPFIITNIFNGVTYEVKDTTGRKFRRHRDHLMAINISQNKCVSEDVYSLTFLASERCINTPKIFF